eukprot:2239865-Alexandrium_andersonii.AAC.1
MTSPWHCGHWSRKGTRRVEKNGNGSSRRCASCVDFDTYFKLCASSPSAPTQSSGRSSLKLISETSDASSSSATSSH